MSPNPKGSPRLKGMRLLMATSLSSVGMAAEKESAGKKA
jgi:hypothetical protein